MYEARSLSQKDRSYIKIYSAKNRQTSCAGRANECRCWKSRVQPLYADKRARASCTESTAEGVIDHAVLLDGIYPIILWSRDVTSYLITAFWEEQISKSLYGQTKSEVRHHFIKFRSCLERKTIIAEKRLYFDYEKVYCALETHLNENWIHSES